MWAIPVVKPEEDLSDVVKVPETEAYKVVETFTLDGVHP